ncbi:hypothetical protein AMS68_005125 [Peltaster fructicola]|uniref:Uncharacterized protein n=1 Tax=Peltaster fructicola TaxID=286661 RepID=A0A6H0XYD9_9PEZI|nr:hypothetical protein AMS68_005125 [Peltaster fructicola]
MAFAAFARVLPRFSTPAVIEDDYEVLDNFDCVSDFGVQSLAESSKPDTIASTAAPSETYIRHSRPLYVIDSWLCSYCPPWDQPQDNTSDALLDFDRELPHCSIDSSDANAMCLAGRGDAGHTFKDVRSAAKSRRRDRVEREKYWGFRVVRRGEMAQPYHADATFPEMFPVIETEPVSARGVYAMAQRYPRPPKPSHRPYYKNRSPFSQTYIKRQKGKKHAGPWTDKLAEQFLINGWDIDRMRDKIDDDWYNWQYTCLTCLEPVDEWNELAWLRVVGGATCSCKAASITEGPGG